MENESKEQKHPDWVKVRYKPSKLIDDVENFLSTYDVHTVCSSALCPNRGECFGSGEMTFLILGKNCTRQCSFCSVDKSKHDPYTDFERDSTAILEAVKRFNIEYVTLTSPTRDDLPDGGASVYADLVKKLKGIENPPGVEILIPDFKGNKDSLDHVIESKPDVLAHNLETIERLYIRARKGADYERSLEILRYASGSKKVITKSAFIVGLGETIDELFDAMLDARETGCEIMVIGQYLRPTANQMPVQRYYTPDEFRMIEDKGRQIDFRVTLAGPLYRSSYKAKEAYRIASGLKEKH
jgi:lipoic acid synthetase